VSDTPVKIGRKSAAASTAFCAVEIDIGSDQTLHIDGNGKITAGNGTLAQPQPNALSLLPGNTEERRTECPGSTAICRASCYVHGLEKHASETFALYEHNTRTLRSIADPVDARGRYGDRFYESAGRVADWIKHNARGGFRWHVSGDVYSDAHAFWILHVAIWSPGVRHWIYTRTFEHAWRLSAIENLTLNLSADAENYERAQLFRHRFGGRICYLTHDGVVPGDLPEGSVIFPDYAFRAPEDAPSPWYDALPKEQKIMTCPVDHRGKSESRRCGPCERCIRPVETAQ